MARIVCVCGVSITPCRRSVYEFVVTVIYLIQGKDMLVQIPSTFTIQVIVCRLEQCPTVFFTFVWSCNSLLQLITGHFGTSIRSFVVVDYSLVSFTR